MPPAFVTHLINRQNVWMIQGRSRIGFLIETAKAFTVSGDVFSEQLERDLPPKSHVLSQVDFAHTARAELFENSVTRNG